MSGERGENRAKIKKLYEFASLDNTRVDRNCLQTV